MVRIVPLGGLSEIGKNMTAIEYGNDIIVVDCGFAFPGDNMLGIDYVIPDFSYLTERKDRIRGFLITHGHEDHIGSLPYALKEIKAPVYGGVLTMGLVQHKLDEHNIKGIHLQRVKSGETVKLGIFEATFIPVCHSISDAFGLKIKTPIGNIVHTGDFKIDHSPIDGRHMDLGAFAKAGEEGVILLMSDSTNSDREGYTPSEQRVARAFENCIEQAKGRVIVATFSSNVSRIQQLIEIAEKHGRKLYFAGRSMSKIVDIASELGYIRLKKGSQVDDRRLDYLEPEEVVIITTGSQGEPMSGLQRMSADEHRSVHLIPGDTVVISASPIPGNEKAVTEMIDRLYRLGVDVISYNTTNAVHVSGHACKEEQKLIMALTKPKFFMPVHGEYHHMLVHAQTAMAFGIPEQNIIVGKNGDVMELTRDGFKVTEELPYEAVYVDGSGIGDVGSVVIRDRQMLSNDGLFIIVATLDKKGQLASGPEVMSRGFVYVKESEEIMNGAKRVAKKAIEDSTKGKSRADWGNTKNAMRNAVRQYLYGETKRNPVILPIIMEVDLEGGR
ncbi:ribonuclease J [Eubacteriales bacterium OttesenSCG-928-M02]|nr:ribonuclease J [Eubacteriales bacterium OttesenSCG-928-M02]